MRADVGGLWKAGLLASFTLALGACEGSNDTEETVQATSGALTVIEPAATDSLAAYAAKCDAATGIHVPAFSCNSAPSADYPSFAVVPQGSSADNLELDEPINITCPNGICRTKNATDPTVQTITAPAGAINGNADTFFYSSVGMGEPNLVEVRITGLTGSSAKAGVMIRGLSDPGMAAGAPNVLLAVNPSGQLIFQYRATRNQATTVTTLPATHAFPLWLRITWTGDVTAQWSTNHVDWTTVGTTTIPDPVYIVPNALQAGVAVAAGTASYDKFMTPKKCDMPNVLGGLCDPGSTFQVLARTADAIAVANCRKEGHTTKDKFGDIAVIQYNRKNGAVCFYQNNTAVTDGAPADTTAPSRGRGPADPVAPLQDDEIAGLFPWETPKKVWGVGCTGCHDNGALIRSPYLWQTGLLPAMYTGYNNDTGNPLRYVGADFAKDKSWVVNTGPTGDYCVGCHVLAVNNVSTPVVPQVHEGQSGTAYRFAGMATSMTQHADFDPDPNTHKNELSPTSPLWMTPLLTPGTWSLFNVLSAAYYRDCAKLFWNAGFQKTGDVPEFCNYQQLGTAYVPPISYVSINDVNIGSSTGQATGNPTSLTVPASPNTNVAGASDNFLFVYANPGTDGSAIVKVKSTPTTAANAKAGLMFRNGQGAGAIDVVLTMTRDLGVYFYYRATTGGQISTPVSLAVSSQAPVWLRLDRSDRTFVGYVSTDDRNTWTQVAPPVTLTSLVNDTEVDYMGLFGASAAADSADFQTKNKAVFESFDWTNAAGWQGEQDPHILVSANIGPAKTGSRKEYTTTETIMTSGSGTTPGDIYGTADEFYYAFKTMTGDGFVQTTVTSQTQSDPWAKAGLMIRSTADANAANIFIGKTPSHGVTMQYRTTAGGDTSTPFQDLATSAALPITVGFQRAGNTITGYYRPNNGSWTLVGTTTIATLGTFPLVGLAVASHSTNATTAKLDSWQTVEPPGFAWSATPPSDLPQASTNNPCALYCANPVNFTYPTGQTSYQSGNLGTGAVCRQTTQPVVGGNCGNLTGGRQLLVNGVQMPCNNFAQWPSIPAKVNGGYCVQVTTGNYSYAAFTVWK